MKHSHICLLIITSFMINSCFKDVETVTKTTTKEKPKITILQNNIVVHVSDEYGKDVQGLTAQFNGEIKIVNTASYFYFNGQNVSKENELLHLTDKQGGKYEYQIYSIENEVNYLEISIFKGFDRYEISSQQDVKIKVSTNFELDLTKNNYKIGNTNYAGNVSIKTNEYDLNNLYHRRSLPSLNYINIDGKWSKMSITKAFRFDMLDSENRTLNVVSPLNCRLTSPQNTNSNLIYYETKTQEWLYLKNINAGETSIEIPSSGIYAFATIDEAAILKGQFFINNHHAKNMTVEVQYDDQIITTQTTNSGKWELPIPKNKNCSIKLIGDCHILYSTNQNTDQPMTNLGTINIGDAKYKSFFISGTLKDCENNNINKAFINVKNGASATTLLLLQSDLTYEIALCVDNSTTEITPIDTTYKVYKSLRYTDQMADMQNVYLCEKLDSTYLVLTNKEGAFKSYPTISGIVSDNNIRITATGQANFIINFKHNNQIEKILNPNANIEFLDDQFNETGIYIDCLTSSNCGFEYFQITMIDKERGLYKGKFKGRFWLRTINPVVAKNMDLEGEFLLRRN